MLSTAGGQKRYEYRVAVKERSCTGEEWLHFFFIMATDAEQAKLATCEVIAQNDPLLETNDYTVVEIVCMNADATSPN